jgi:hypothetical protein
MYLAKKFIKLEAMIFHLHITDVRNGIKNEKWHFLRINQELYLSLSFILIIVIKFWFHLMSE